VVPIKEGNYQEVENWLVSADGREHSVIALPESDAVEDWSADGKWLAVVSRKSGEIAVVKPDGSERRRIASVADANSIGNPRPRFSPDGRAIIYLHTVFSGADSERTVAFSLRVVNFDGSEDREILGERAADSKAAVPIWTAPMAARWSPDGKHIAVVLFDHTRSGGIAAIGGNWRLAMMDAAGGNLRELKLEGVLNLVLPYDGPDWRP
jgi:Tol biopolymer transport system component